MAPRDPADPFELGTLVCRDPATGERLGSVSVPSNEDRRSMIGRARTAAARWTDAPSVMRRHLSSAVVDGIVDRIDELCRLVAHTTGKTMVDALLGELVPTCATVSRTRPRGPTRPPAVVAVLASREHPLHDTLVPCVCALVAGRAVVVVPEPTAAWSCVAFVELVRDALRDVGADPELVALAPSVGDREADLQVAGIDTVYEIERGPRLLWLTDRDDLTTAVDAAMLATFTPFAAIVPRASAVAVPSAVYRPFVDEARRRVCALHVGSPLDAVDCGALASASHRDRLDTWVCEAVAAGATVVAGGRPLPDLGHGFFAPTLLEIPDVELALAGARLGGPLMSVIEVAEGDRGRALATRHGADLVVLGDRRDSAGAPPCPPGLGLTGLLGAGLEAATVQTLGRASTESALLAAVLPYPVDAATYGRLEGLVRLSYGRGVRRRVRAALDWVRTLGSNR